VWQHTEHGAVRGTELWSAAERQGRTTALRRWLLGQACQEIARLDDGRIDVAVSLPLSMVDPEGLAAEVASALEASGLAPSRLAISFTEETLLTSSAALVPELEAVRRTGVRLCLDNYGMGHSIFALLARISLDILRADISALAPRDDTDRALLVMGMIARTAASFGLTSIAGGIGPELRAGVVATGVNLLHGRSEPHDLTVEELAVLVSGGDPVPAA
jgi:EAL domain-containing protein (putative c-di-GMP-specific phosphodiesterase class I)